MPWLSVTTTGYCAPAVEPADTKVGLPFIVMTSSVFAPAGPDCTTQLAFVAQMMSATVFVLPPLHVAGPAWVAVPQSLSVTRITAFAAMDMASLKSTKILSPASSVFAKPPDEVSVADDEVGGVVSPVPGMFTGT